MRDPKRIEELLKLIKKIWKNYPDLRLCQLIGNVYGPEDLYHKEDDDLKKRLEEYYDISKE